VGNKTINLTILLNHQNLCTTLTEYIYIIDSLNTIASTDKKYLFKPKYSMFIPRYYYKIYQKYR